ncbi:MAG TPA: DNA/RNA non-specific endonuclease [Candidatus Luteococcus avicola]|nr:DNA/RNA non-specific endonuclease [Candidatus Luteococcus avicola]
MAPGFDPEFLSTTVSLPRLTAGEDDAVVVNGSSVIDYTHFSLAFSASRRFARWVAWNVDGKQMRKLSRSSMKFRLDPRVPSQMQVGDELYSDNRIDRGHVARRADLTWGSDSEANQANSDSFYFTNITPQVRRLQPVVPGRHLVGCVNRLPKPCPRAGTSLVGKQSSTANANAGTTLARPVRRTLPPQILAEPRGRLYRRPRLGSAAVGARPGRLRRRCPDLRVAAGRSGGERRPADEDLPQHDADDRARDPRQAVAVDAFDGGSGQPRPVGDYDALPQRVGERLGEGADHAADDDGRGVLGEGTQGGGTGARAESRQCPYPPNCEFSRGGASWWRR